MTRKLGEQSVAVLGEGRCITKFETSITLSFARPNTLAVRWFRFQCPPPRRRCSQAVQIDLRASAPHKIRLTLW